MQLMCLVRGLVAEGNKGICAGGVRFTGQGGRFVIGDAMPDLGVVAKVDKGTLREEWDAGKEPETIRKKSGCHTHIRNAP